MRNPVQNTLVAATALAAALFGFVLSEALYSTNDKKKGVTPEEIKSLKLEMIDYDIYIRNIASAIAAQSYYDIKLNLKKLSVIKNIESPYHKERLQSLLAKMEGSQSEQILAQLHTIADSAAQYVEAETEKKRTPDMKKILEEYQNILNACRACHQSFQNEFEISK